VCDLQHRLWSAPARCSTAPETVAAVHLDYLDAGADVITTATYQAEKGTPPFSMLQLGVELARRERDAFVARSAAGRPRPLVAASIGPYGAMLADGSEYRGGYGLDLDALTAWHRPRLRELEESGADLLAFRDDSSLIEVEAIARLLAERDGTAGLDFLPGPVTRRASPRVRRWPKPPRSRIARLACSRSARELCSAREVEPMLRTLATATRKDLAAYPNRGDTWDPVTRSWIPRPGVVDLAALSRTWRAAGATLIGGCCRTTPADIASMLEGDSPLLSISRASKRARFFFERARA
jgi:homocysteine S-methyltransferase